MSKLTVYKVIAKTNPRQNRRTRARRVYNEMLKVAKAQDWHFSLLQFETKHRASYDANDAKWDLKHRNIRRVWPPGKTKRQKLAVYKVLDWTNRRQKRTRAYRVYSEVLKVARSNNGYFSLAELNGAYRITDARTDEARNYIKQVWPS